MNRAASGAAALLVLLALTGCGQWFVQHDVAEEPLRVQVSDLATVVEVASAVDSTFGATVEVTVSELVGSELQAIVARADELLAGRDVNLQIVFDQNSLLKIVYPNEFSAEGLANEVQYWLAVSSANGAPLGMLLQNGPNGRYRNIWDPDESDAVDWEALRAVPDTSLADRSWYLDDFVANGVMPTAEVVAFRDRLAAITLSDDESVEVGYVAPGFVEVRYESPLAGLSDPTVAANWPRVQEIVSQLVALGLPQSNFVFNSDGFGTVAILHLGECADLEVEEPHWASAELVAALSGSGIEFPVGVHSGFCNDAYDLP